MKQADDYDRYYADKLNGALEYQDWVQDVLYDHGLSVGAYSSRKYQNEKGENRCGIEIKFDQKWRETGNLYIETDEKAHPSRPAYSRSGIWRGDNSWLYVIGDYTVSFVFAKATLKLLDGAKSNGIDRYRHVITPTSKGFLLPIDDGRRYAAKVIEPGENGTHRAPA